MNLTKALKSWIVANCKGIKPEASDDEFKKAAGSAIATGQLSVEKFTELTKDAGADEVNEFSLHLKTLGDGISKLTDILTKENKNANEGETEEQKTARLEAEKATKEEKDKTKAGKVEWHKSMKRMLAMDPPVDDDGNIRVKGAWEGYEDTKKTLVFPSHTKSGKAHPLAGKPVVSFDDHGHVMNESSDLDKAINGAFAKFLCATAQRGGSKTFGFQSLPQHDKELLFYALDKKEWGGATDGGDDADIKNRRLTPQEQKALIDDAVSGGIIAAPIVFDDDVIQTPLLHGELFPLVRQVPLDRGRRVEGVETGTVTSRWGGVDDTAIPLFNTAGYITAFDTTIYRWEGAIHIGLDFLSDTPIDFGQHITQQYGERLLEDMDNVIATGNGNTQPEGIINKAGTTAINFGAATTIGNYESLRFGVVKAEHRANVAASAVFCGTETSYMRIKAVPVGAGDARRIFGTGPFGTTGYDDYRVMDRPYKINESLNNQQIFYAILARYRMYRRRGLTMRTSTEGDTLIRGNEMLMVAMARYGGQLERGACASVTVTAPA